jgi:hypothetical protein
VSSREVHDEDDSMTLTLSFNFFTLPLARVHPTVQASSCVSNLVVHTHRTNEITLHRPSPVIQLHYNVASRRRRHELSAYLVINCRLSSLPASQRAWPTPRACRCCCRRRHSRVSAKSNRYGLESRERVGNRLEDVNYSWQTSLQKRIR